jgi:hypothetical protein
VKKSTSFDFRLALEQFRIRTIVVDAVNLIFLGFPKIMLVNFTVTFFVKVGASGKARPFSSRFSA